MIHFAEFISPQRVVFKHKVSSKKRALEKLSEMVASTESGISQAGVFEALLERERLGSTGLGHGVALPHGRVKGLEYIIGACLRLKEGIDYDAIDNQPVDLIYMLLVPEKSTDDHLALLAELAEMFRHPPSFEKLYSAKNADELYQTLNAWSSTQESRQLA